MLYLPIIFVTMVLTIGAAVCVSVITHSISIAYAILGPLFVLAYVLVVLGICALGMRWLIPKSAWNFESKLFRVSKCEVKFYDRIGIRKWKSLVPEMGNTAGFPKRELKTLDTDYLGRFLWETCYAEGLHFTVGVLGLTALFFVPVRDFYFAVPIVLVNLILHLLPCFIQRYVRYKMLKVYEHQKRVAQKTPA